MYNHNQAFSPSDTSAGACANENGPSWLRGLVGDLSSSQPSRLRALRGAAPLTHAAEADLVFKIIHEGCTDSREQLMRATYPLVVANANRFAGRGATRSALIEHGILGLLGAVESFDPRHGSRFSTYASWGIKQAMKNATSQARLDPSGSPA